MLGVALGIVQCMGLETGGCDDRNPPLQGHAEQVQGPRRSVLHPSTHPLPNAGDDVPCPECHRVGIIQYDAFSDCLLSRSCMHLRSLHAFSFLCGPE